MITIIILKISRIKIHDVNGYSLNIEVGYAGHGDQNHRHKKNEKNYSPKGQDILEKNQHFW